MGNDFDQEDAAAPRKPRKKRFRETTGRLRRGEEAHVGHRASMDWRHDRSRVCDPAPAREDIAALDGLRKTLMKSRTSKMLLTGAAGRGLEIVYDRQTPAAQYYNRAGRRIIALNPFRPRGDLLNLLARELRRAWQDHKGALVNPLRYDPDAAILINRAQTADTLTTAVKVAWELKLAGEQEAWNWIAGSPMADVVRTFESRAQGDFRTLNNGEAARAAYDRFFEDGRTKIHDKRIIHQMLLDESGYMKGDSPPPLSPELFIRLGEMPGSRNYLSGRKARSPTDPSYMAVEDRSNANFLWFIKFERSFQEKEMRMMEESVKLSAQIVDFAKWSLRHGPARGPGA